MKHVEVYHVVVEERHVSVRPFAVGEALVSRQSRAVVEQKTCGDTLVRELGDIFSDIDVIVNLALASEYHDSLGGEYLGDGA